MSRDEFDFIELNDEKKNKSTKKSKASAKKDAKREAKLEKKQIRISNKSFRAVTYFFVAIFFALIIYFVYFVEFKADDFINSPYNTRLSNLEDNVIRGDITDRNGTVLATTNTSNSTEVRVYPYGRMFAHAIGYKDKGMYGVELDGNFSLLRSHANIVERITKEIKEEKNTGDTVVTTLDYSVQEAAYNSLKSYKGAAIAIEPSTGKIVSMVSLPDYNPATIEADWDDLVEDNESSALLNRSTQGLYPPGSTFKIVTALEYLREEDGDVSNFEYDCSSSLTLNDYTIHCSHNKSHGLQNFQQAFGNSCNCAFAYTGLSLDKKSYNKTASDLMFNKSLPTKLSNVKQSTVTINDDVKDSILMQTAIGQGSTTVTPIHMCMIAAAVCNDGWVNKPYMIDKITNYAGSKVRTYHKTPYKQIMTNEESDELEEYMRYVVTNGTANRLANQYGFTCYGKTGTAEYTSDKNKTHSWFVGYAKSDGSDEELAVTVIVEGAGTGSEYAVPIAQKMFSAYFN